MDHLRQRAGEAVRKEVEKAIQKAQEMKSDFRSG